MTLSDVQKKETKIPVYKKSEMGVGMLEIVIVILIMAIVTTIAVMGITKVRYDFLLSTTGDSLKSYLEKAGSDARRRHAQGSSRSVVQVLSPTSYQVLIDFDGDGQIETRIINLPKEVTFFYNSAIPPKATFDWRGNIEEGTTTFTLKTYQNQTLQTRVTGSGDASVDENFPTLPTVSVTPTSADIDSESAITGTGTPNTEVSPTPIPSPLPVCTTGQLPGTNNCRCATGKVVKSDGKCS